ncbi:hypothetical protein BU52_28805 [Streptomyces toyocaensis]|uniref:Uncharacterized protein n=1 Tax=Streptomyces toyocaensis TaxID=55952 RepID=A0A081XJJ8_STRTO|nr:hypothetical protein BU52_28805 [Streptomyces toyocaensis]
MPAARRRYWYCRGQPSTFFQREEPGLAAAADAVSTPAVESDDDRMTQALEIFHAVLRPAL